MSKSESLKIVLIGSRNVGKTGKIALFVKFIESNIQICLIKKITCSLNFCFYRKNKQSAFYLKSTSRTRIKYNFTLDSKKRVKSF